MKMSERGKCMQSDLAIDTGTSNTLIFTAGKGVVINEPSVIALDREKEEITAVGKTAYAMLGRVSPKKEVIFPIKEGVIADYGTACDMLVTFLKKIMHISIVMPKTLICVPSEMTAVEKNAFASLINDCGIRRIGIIKQPVASAMGAGIDIEDPHGAFIVSLGGGMADMAVISLGGTAVTGTVRIAGNSMDDEIIKYIKQTYNIRIGRQTAEQAKINAGSVISGTVAGTYTIKGKCMVTGMPVKADIDAEELVKPLQKTADIIIEKIQEVLVNTPPELIGDIHKDGIVLTGGLARLRGFDKYISNAVGLNVKVAEEPELCAIKGTGMAIKYMNSSKSKINPTITISN